MNNQNLVKRINRRLFIKRTFNRFISDLVDIPQWLLIGMAVVIIALVIKL